MEKWDAATYLFNIRVAVVNIVGNVIMFVPFGAFLPAMWPKLQKAWKAILSGLLVIILVELCQLLTLRGRCDVDDVLLNMMGIIFGYGLWSIVKFCRSRKK